MSTNNSDVCVVYSVLEIDFYQVIPFNNLRLKNTRIKMTDKCLRNYFQEQLNYASHIFSSKMYTQSLHKFSSPLEILISKRYSTECTIKIAMFPNSNSDSAMMSILVK